MRLFYVFFALAALSLAGSGGATAGGAGTGGGGGKPTMSRDWDNFAQACSQADPATGSAPGHCFFLLEEAMASAPICGRAFERGHPALAACVGLGGTVRFQRANGGKVLGSCACP